MNARVPALAALLLCMIASPVLAGVLSGRITGPGGSGVHPLDIDAFDELTDAWVPLSGDTTSTTGHYSIALPPGVYRIRFVPTYASRLFTEDVGGVTVGAGTTVLDRTLEQGVRVSGRVVDGGGSGIPLVDLDFRAAGGEPAGNLQDDRTDGNGDFAALVEPGVWDVQYAPTLASRWVPEVRTATVLTGDTVLPDLVMSSGYYVDVSVTDLGYFPVGDADIDVRPSAGGPKRYVPSDNTDASGMMRMVLPSGTWDITARPPQGAPLAARTAWSVPVSSDLVLPVLDLPPAGLLTARSLRAGSVAVPGVDLDVDSLPALRRLEAPGDVTASNGQVAVRVPQGSFRVTLTPPVASRLLPVRLAPVAVGPAGVALGDIVHASGHWLDVNVIEQGSGLPVAGADLDFIRIASGQPAITAGDVTDGGGGSRVVLDTDLYRLRVVPPSADWDTLVVEGLRTLNDTTLTLVLAPSTLHTPRPVHAAVQLAAPWPNPVRGRMTAALNLAGPLETELDVCDAAGRTVATLLRTREAGAHRVIWNLTDSRGRAVPAGLYWLRAVSGDAVQSRRVVVLR